MSVRELQARGATVETAATRRRMRLRAGDWAVRIGSIAAVLLAWEFIAPRFNPLIIRPPSAVFRAFFELVDTGELQDALGQSLRELSGGFARGTGRYASARSPPSSSRGSSSRLDSTL